jgi:polar amino acid transport system substrate-binding protein
MRELPRAIVPIPSAQTTLIRETDQMLKSVMQAAAVALAMGGLGAAVTPAEARSLDEILSSGVVRVGVNPSLPPRALYDDNNEMVGFEPDVAAAIAEKLGVELELIRVGSPDRIPFVASGRVDFVMGAMARTAERAKVIDYTVPVHTASYGIVTPQGSGIESFEDLNSEDVTLVQVRGTTAVAWLEENVPNASLLLLDNYNDRDRALGQGRADASFDGIDSVAYRLRIFPEREWNIIPYPDYGVEYSGLGVQKGNYTLRDWLNIALFDLHRTGFIEAAWEEWFLKPMPTPVPYSPWF